MAGRPIPERMDVGTLWELTMGLCSGKKVSVHTDVGALKAGLGRKRRKRMRLNMHAHT